MPVSVATRTKTKFFRHPEWTGRHSTLAIFMDVRSGPSAARFDGADILQDELPGRRRRADESVTAVLDVLLELSSGGVAVAALDGGEKRAVLAVRHREAAAEFETVAAIDPQLLAHLRVEQSKASIAGRRVQRRMERDVEVDIALGIRGARSRIHRRDERMQFLPSGPFDGCGGRL